MNKEEKRNTILKAASEASAQAGMHKTNLNDIARRAGMAKTSLYYYFKDKEDLINAVFQYEQDQFLDMVENTVECQDSVEAKMVSLMEIYFIFITRKSRWISMELMAENRPPSSMIPWGRDNFLMFIKDFIRHILHEGVRKGELKPIEDFDLMAWVILSSMVGSEYLFVFHKRHDWVMEVMRSMVRTLFTGMNNRST
ncbi:MAG TPA: TetR/AcrR family transcriptional regulator [Methanoregulaceae archaeon]|nr:TetR/AcrR family transcriptional regulator [Bacteroidales bacterium]HQM56724.1 TetR/AcrR family transcriptional regulator [Methanoregulaceae archaeon]